MPIVAAHAYHVLFRALEYNTTYTATLKASIKSAAGVAMAQDLMWSFSTAADANSVVPAPGSDSGFKIIARSPNSREAGVAHNASITVEFSKPLGSMYKWGFSTRRQAPAEHKHPQVNNYPVPLRAVVSSLAWVGKRESTAMT